ncbi:MAG: DNA polymerase III subunit beta [Paenisporosarcina sp.]
MEFIINNECLDKAISDVSRAVSLNTPFPILTGIKIVANKNTLSLTGSNSNIVIEKVIPLTVEGLRVLEVITTGSVVVPAKYLSEIVKKLSNDIRVKVNDKQCVTIQSDEIVTSLNGFDSEEYPSLPEIDLNHNIKISSEALLQIINQTIFAVGASETRPVLTGVNMTFEQNKLTCAATNSSRLALGEIEIESAVNGSFIVPSPSLKELSKLINVDSGEINIFISKSHIIFKINSTTLFSRLIVGNYPNVSDLIPKDFMTIITLDTKQFLKGIDRACLFASEWKNNNITLDIKDDLKIKISSNSTEIGKIEETQSIKNLSGLNELSISLDGRFLMDALKIIKEEQIKITFSGPMKPISIQPINNTTHLHLISPVRSY